MKIHLAMAVAGALALAPCAVLAQNIALSPDTMSRETLARLLAADEGRLSDWAKLDRYRAANAELGAPKAGEKR
ncbi:MAG TPA: hypothetical protein VF832_06075, partial [Longimicrobiales bacterium]